MGNRSIVGLCSVSTMTTPTQQTWAADERREQIQRPEDGKITVVVPGIELCPLAGAHSRCSRSVHGSVNLESQGILSALCPAIHRGIGAGYRRVRRSRLRIGATGLSRSMP